MCTIVVLNRVHTAYPVLVAANRDEFYARETRGPTVLASNPRAVGGLDVEKGGSWMGANASGVVGAITNQRTHQLPDPNLRSRGEVVLGVLGETSNAGARAAVESLDPAEYNSFNLLFGDAAGLFVAYSRHERRSLEVEAIPQGISVIPNDRIGSPEFPKIERATRLAEEVQHQPWPEVGEALRRVLGDHALPSPERVPEPPPGSILPASFVRPLQALCVHTPNYGTRSATLVALERGRVAHFLHADGPPCRTRFEDFSALLEDTAPEAAR